MRILAASVNMSRDVGRCLGGVCVVPMTVTCAEQTRRRAHAERMLARAQRRSRQALKLVEKWQAKIAALDREGVAATQARLFPDDLPEGAARSQESTL